MKADTKPREPRRQLRLVRMCGGRVRWGIRRDGTYGRLHPFARGLRRAPGAIIWDGAGVALAWGSEWGRR